MSEQPKIAYAGMTHLGLCSAAAAAGQGFLTLGFDPDGETIGKIAGGALPVIEPGLPELIDNNAGRLKFSSDPAALAQCDLIYVAPDTPTDESGLGDLSGLDHLLKLVLAQARAHATVVVLSQVPPGYMRSWQGPDKDVYYQVETLIFGRAVERATQPERFIIGCPHPERPLPQALISFLVSFDCPILPMRLESAELTKIAINCCLAASVTVANTLAELCERSGADWMEIAPALKLDRRIGAYSYLTPGLGISGGNIERDLATVIRASLEYGTDAGLIRSFVNNSAYRKDWALRTLHEALLARRPDAILGILGLSYKENTHSVKNSPSLALIAQLAPWRIKVFDPAVAAAAAVHPAVTAASTALDAADGVDGLALMTPWPQFRDLPCTELARRMRGRLVVDPYRILEPDAARRAGLDHRVLGVS